jgi:hypothetical protein
MPDFDAISVALAARYAAAQVTPPAGLTNIRYASANVPNQTPNLPAVLVFPTEGELDHIQNTGSRLGLARFRVLFYYAATGDALRDSVALRKWTTVLIDQLKISVQLGGIVALASCTAWKIGILQYMGKDYSGVELTVEITTTEPWAAVA